MNTEPSKITGANTGGPHQLPSRTPWAARIAKFTSLEAAANTMRFLSSFFVCGMALLATSCHSLKTASQPSGLPLRYRNAQYDLTFFLPASWRGYSVLVQQLDDERYSFAEDRQIIVGHTPMITLRHPQRQDSAPYQDIPILVFSRSQWDALHHGELWPSLFAGGTMGELWRNQGFVFAMSSRYNATNEVSGWKEVAEIIERNRTTNTMPYLYPE